ncbi:retroviral-like aspartic protease family protein [Sphingobium lignivorans]|uniref:Aspartyl protease n=1 Tax=Sphingobium lignivorans TaxID=2735886 RepID=A0ABR6NM88_9SPHN|nr:retroviral-like aspartic protease family protein [Sphingobium lignivorans]MBB5987817.1 putative aspartyl protease [Sphingobium lignivorans]
MSFARRLIMRGLVALAFGTPFIAPGAMAQKSTAAPAPSPDPVPGDFVVGAGKDGQAFDPSLFELTERLLLLGKDRSNRMTMPVEIGGSSYDFLIDTGSQRTIVATELAQRLALPSLPPVEIVSMAGRVTVASVALEGLRLGEHAIEDLKALSIAHADLGGAGLIGLDTLKDKRLTLDFRKRRMDIGESRRRPPTSDPDTIVVQARSRFGQLILVDSRVEGRRVSVILDTGAEMSVGNMALFRSLKLKKLVVPPQPTMLTSVTGAEVPALFTVVRRITIGSVTLDNVPMVFLDAAPFEELDLADKPAMLLGMRMLRLFDRIAIDFGSRRVDFHLDTGFRKSDAARLASAAAPAAVLP